ncbi:hypothetical protein ACOTI1_24255 [Achromobacter xylosoxidans]
MKPSDNEIEMLAAGFAIQHKNGLIRFAHALLEKYASARASTVAGEAQPLGYVMKGREWPNQCYYPSSHKPTDIHNWTPVFDHAAPQASAEDALTAPADVAQLVAFIFDRFGQPGDAGALPDNVAAAVRRLERGIKAQADKDGEACAKGDGNV